MKSVSNISEWVTVQASERPHQRALVFLKGEIKPDAECIHSSLLPKRSR